LINLRFDLFDKLPKGQGDGIRLHWLQKQRVGICCLPRVGIGDSLPNVGNFGKEILPALAISCSLLSRRLP